MLDALDGRESSIDQIVQRCRMPVSEVTSTLLRLEIRGLVLACPGARFTRRG